MEHYYCHYIIIVVARGESQLATCLGVFCFVIAEKISCSRCLGVSLLTLQSDEIMYI